MDVDKQIAEQSLRHTARALEDMADNLSDMFRELVSSVDNCSGMVVVSGMGKSGYVAEKIAATLASIGVQARYLNASNALHGECGSIKSDDLLLLISNSGHSMELVQLAEIALNRGGIIAAITSDAETPVGRASHIAVATGQIQESFTRGPVPTTSAIIALSLGDALAIAVAERRQLLGPQIISCHPGGHIGTEQR